MDKQITNALFMVRPVAFRMNEQTAVNNYFQTQLDLGNDVINQKAQSEFDAFVAKLRGVGVKVVVLDDIKEQNTPDSIFPNNWISFHQSGDVILYPMFAENRRKERRLDVLDRLKDEGFMVGQMTDYTHFEAKNQFLEGTGSMIFDRANKIAYCALSPRADRELFEVFCADIGYTPVVFSAYQTVGDKRELIYHANVMMALGESLCVICLDSIDDVAERQLVIDTLQKTGKEIITISEAQMHQFAGNMLQVAGNDGAYLVMSQSAFDSLTDEQVADIGRHCKILSSDLTTIETCGGGSARCMMAEVFLPS